MGHGLLESILSWIAVVLLGAKLLIAVFLLIPGPEPERTLQKLVDLLSGVSRK